MKRTKEFWNILIDRIVMNLPRPFNKRINEMIDAFMKTKPIFQSPHSKEFMHPNDTMFTASPHELKYIYNKWSKIPHA
jgi:hypothetical protein